MAVNATLTPEGSCRIDQGQGLHCPPPALVSQHKEGLAGALLLLLIWRRAMGQEKPMMGLVGEGQGRPHARSSAPSDALGLYPEPSTAFSKAQAARFQAMQVCPELAVGTQGQFWADEAPWRGEGSNRGLAGSAFTLRPNIIQTSLPLPA